MNFLMAMGAATGTGGLGATVLGDSCALFLFIVGGLSLTIAAYMLYKAPKSHAAREIRRYR